jgi:hypothetical protein
MGGGLVQLDGSVSIKSMEGCWNNNTEGEIGPELSWPRRVFFAVYSNRFGGNPELELLRERLLLILGSWMLNYPMELTVASIYRERERWSRI